MALPPDFPTDPHVILDPDQRWFPGEDERGGKALDRLLPPLVNRIRRGVKEWRDAGYAGASPTTAALLRHWFETEHQVYDADGHPQRFRYYFAQREAVESAIWLYEVEQARDPLSLLKYDAAGGLAQREFPEDWTRYVLKLATGTGKTKVMSLLVAWAYFHRKYEPGSDLSTNFLLIAPNIIVLDRLRTDFDDLRIFRDDPVLPPDGFEDRDWSSDFQMTLHIQDEIGPLSDLGNLFLSNIHRVFLNDDAPPSIDDDDATDFILGKRPKKTSDSGMDLGEIIRRVHDLVILNDEAHHIHDKNMAWFKNIQEIAAGLRIRDSRLSVQIDLTATPRQSTSKAIFPQTICDYPLVEAIRQRVVKNPVLPDKDSSAKLSIHPSEDYVERYGDYLRLGYEEWKKATEELTPTGKKPLLFVMTDDTTHCDEVGEFLARSFPELHDAVLVIHTNKSGDISESSQSKNKKELDLLRKESREIDSLSSRFKAVVSVMVLREGWDVRNVVSIVGLRAFEAENEILPEQTLGRGLRRMFAGEDRVERVSVIGTPNFIGFVERIKDEGVELEHVPMGPRVQPAPPLTIEVDRANPAKDIDRLNITLPILAPRVRREYEALEGMDPATWTFRPLALQTFTSAEQREIRFVDIDRDRESHTTTLADHHHPTIQNFIGYFAEKVRQDSRLIGNYAVLHGKIKEFVANQLFGQPIDLDDPNIPANLNRVEVRNTIFETTRKAVNAATVHDRGSTEPIGRISFAREITAYSVVDQERYFPKKSILNKIVGDSHFELEFAAFLDGCQDIISFLKNSQSTHFRIEYQKADGAIANYYPDFIVKQSEDEVWIIETKGREDLDDPRKWARLQQWTENATESHPGCRYHALFVSEAKWRDSPTRSFNELCRAFQT